MGERILVCTQGEPGAMGALRVANALAERDGAAVDVLTVVEPVYLETMAVYPISGQFTAAADHVAAGYRGQVEAQLREAGGPAAAAEPQVEVGHAAYTIAAFAESAGDRMIVVGSGPHRRVDRWLGSETPLYVSRLSRVPVLSVPPEAEGLPRSAVVGADFSEYARDAALAAAALVGRGGRLTLVHATWVPLRDTRGDEWETTYRVGAGERLSALARELEAETGVEVERRIVEAVPAGALLAVAREVGADVVAAGSHGHGFFTRMVMGSTSTRLLRLARCAVLIAPPRAPSPELEQAADERRRRREARARAAEAPTAAAGAGTVTPPPPGAA
jgi:nucleotide-binding universal stress UspA family protein